MGHVQDSPVSTKMILDECMIYHMKVHIVSYSLDPKKFSKSNIHISPNYERTDSKTAIVPLRPTQFRHLCIKKRRKSSRNLNVSVTLVCDVCLNFYISYHSLSYLIVIPTTTTMEMVFCYQNCSYLLWEKNCTTDREKLLKFQAESWEFAKFLRLLEQFIQAVKGQNNFW